MTSGAEGSRTADITALSALNLKKLGDDKTAVAYQFELDVLGRLGKPGAGPAHKVADSMGDRFIAALRERTEAGKPWNGDRGERPALAAAPARFRLWHDVRRRKQSHCRHNGAERTDPGKSGG